MPLPEIPYHKHNGVDSPKVEATDIRDLEGGFAGVFFETVTTEPSGAPTSFLDQVKLYDDGAGVLLYVYDTNNSSWERFNYYTP